MSVPIRLFNDGLGKRKDRMSVLEFTRLLDLRLPEMLKNVPTRPL